MRDVFSHHAEEQIPVLRPIRIGSESPHLTDEGRAEHRQVGQIVRGQHCLGRPRRFEDGMRRNLAIGRQDVVVRIDHIGLRLVVQRLRYGKKSMGLEHVVVVEQSHELTLRHLERDVGVPRNAEIARQAPDPQARITAGIVLQQIGHGRRGGAAVHQAQLPVRIALREHRIEHGAQGVDRGVVGRSDDADQWAMGKARHRLALTFEVLRGGGMARSPSLIGQPVLMIDAGSAPPPGQRSAWSRKRRRHWRGGTSTRASGAGSGRSGRSGGRDIGDPTASTHDSGALAQSSMTTWPDSADVACRPGAVLGFARGSEEGTPLTPAPPSWLKWFGLEHAVPLLANVVLALALSWPLVRDFTTLFAGNIVADQVHAIWISWNVRQWLFGNAPLFTAPLLYYPVGSSLLLDGVGPVSGLLTLPFWGWGVVAAYNGAVILGLALSGYAMYLLARALDFTRGVALLAAVVLQLTPSHVAGLYGHLEKILIALPALVLLGLYRAFKEQGQWWWWWALVTAMTWLLVGLHSGYLFAHTIVAVVFFVVVAVLGAKGESRRQATRRAAVLAALSAVILGPFLVAVVRVAADPAFLVRLNTMSGYYAPDVTQLFIPPSYNAMFGWLNTRFAWLASRPRAGMDIDVETAVTLSWTACLLAVCVRWRAGIGASGRGRHSLALFVVLSLGPFLRLFGYERFTDFKLPIILPYAVLDSFPGFSFMRCSGRFMMVGAIGLSVLACFGVTRLQTLFPRWRGLVVIVAIAFVARRRLAEGMAAMVSRPALPSVPLPHGNGPRHGYVWRPRSTGFLAAGQWRCPVHVVPALARQGHRVGLSVASLPGASGSRLVRRLIEGGRTDAGQSGSDSGAFAAAQAELSRLGYRYVIWHKTQTDMKGAVPTQEFIEGAFGKVGATAV